METLLVIIIISFAMFSTAVLGSVIGSIIGMKVMFEHLTKEKLTLNLFMEYLEEKNAEDSGSEV